MCGSRRGWKQEHSHVHRTELAHATRFAPPHDDAPGCSTQGNAAHPTPPGPACRSQTCPWPWLEGTLGMGCSGGGEHTQTHSFPGTSHHFGRFWSHHSAAQRSEGWGFENGRTADSQAAPRPVESVQAELTTAGECLLLSPMPQSSHYGGPS